MKNSPQYQIKAADWRRQIEANDHKTWFVIGAFFAIYLAVGLLIDLYIHPMPADISWQDTLVNLITLQIIPVATLIIGCIALFSILIAYAFYDKIVLLGTNYKEITPKTASSMEEQQLYNVIEELKIAAGMHYMPKVFIIDAPYMNAFASGYSEKSALVAITSGLMQKLNRSELQAVMAHELSHIRHHDIKLTMAASIMANILLIAIDIIFQNVIFGSAIQSRNGRSNQRGEGNAASGIAFIIIILRFVLPILTAVLMLFLSRTREYMADAGSVELTRDNTPLANALIKINDDQKQHRDEYTRLYQNTPHEDIRRAAYLFDPGAIGFSLTNLFSTHPPLAARLKALGYKIHAR